MDKDNHWFHLIILSFALILGAASSSVAEVTISVSADKTKIALNESVRLSVTISGSGNLPSPQLPDLSNFNVYSSGRSHNISFINGQMSSSIVYSYVLSPKSIGKFTIAPFSVMAEGKTIQTQPLEIEVVSAPSVPSTSAPVPQKSPTPGQSPGAFVSMAVDKSKVFVNEQVILTFRFYNKMNLLSNPEYQPPEKTGFIFEDLPPPRNFVESVQGTQYHVTEIKTALFSTRAGKLTISPATLKIRVEDFASNPFSDDFFRHFFGGSAKEYLLKTNPIHLTVLPLPTENRPHDFSGAVGEFKITASADKRKLAVGEPLTLTLSVTGIGNIKSLGDPILPSFTGFRKYDTASSLNIDSSKGRVEGSKVYKIILVPQASGLQTIPPIAFSYFDPSSKRYKTETTSSISLEIFPSKSTGVVLSPVNFTVPEIQRLQQEIRYIKLDAIRPSRFTRLHRTGSFLLANFFPVLILMGAFFFRWRKSLLERNPEKRRFRNAYKKLKKELDALGIARKDVSEGNASKIFEIVRNYFADKMLLPPSSLSLKLVENYLRQNGLDSETVQQFKTLWSKLELFAYAPSEFRNQDLKSTLLDVAASIKKINAQLKK